jgi:hypothetical protein
MLDMYGITDPAQRDHLAGLARHSQRKNWWIARDDLLPPGTCHHLTLESAASRLRASSP